MKIRSCLIAAAVVAGATFTPARAPAQTACGYTFSLGIGGSLSGCFAGVISMLSEDAGLVSNQYYWAGNFTGSAGTSNAPVVAGTFMFDNNCGGDWGYMGFCTGPYAKTPALVTSTSGEFVLGLNVPDPVYGGSSWVYSGDAARNATPPPTGYQAVLLQLTLGGIDSPGEFLFGWEDLNTGCTARVATSNNRFRIEDLGNGPLLDSVLDNCSAETSGGTSDSDFNDSYMRFSITGSGTPTDINITPEPMTMSLMAVGLVALGGASLRRQRRHRSRK